MNVAAVAGMNSGSWTAAYGRLLTAVSCADTARATSMPTTAACASVRFRPIAMGGLYDDRVRIVVLGAGAIGSIYGARLSTAHDVTLIARAAHADAINRDGLRVTGGENRTYRVPAATSIDRIDADALVILATKVSD